MGHYSKEFPERMATYLKLDGDGQYCRFKSLVDNDFSALSKFAGRLQFVNQDHRKIKHGFG